MPKINTGKKEKEKKGCGDQRNSKMRTGCEMFKEDASENASRKDAPIKNVQKSVYHNIKFSEECTSLCRKFCEQEQCISNGRNINEQKLEKSVQPSPPGWDELELPKKSAILVLLEDMIKKFQHTNVVIAIDDAQFHCHIEVLQCYSKFFENLSNETVIPLPPEITQEAFITVYCWMLSDDPVIEREGIVELFNAAQILKIPDLEAQCWGCLDDDQQLREDSAFLLYLEAEKYGDKVIMQLMLSRISKFFLMLVASHEFQMLKCSELCSLLRSNAISVNSEIEILMAATRWLHYDWINRKEFLVEIIKCVRFALIPIGPLVAMMNESCDSEEVKSIICVPEVKKMVNDGVTSAIMNTKQNEENVVDMKEKLKLVDPEERQWIRDELSIQNFRLSNKELTYETFLNYLQMIRKIGPDHWKTLKHLEATPKLDVYAPNCLNQTS